MKEQLISESTARLAKSKHFNWPTLFWYQQNHNAGPEFILIEDEIGTDQINVSQMGYSIEGIDHNHSNYILARLNAPTQSHLQKWIREVHKIHIVIDGKAFKIYTNGNKILPTKVFIAETEYYEDVLELALLEALNIIKDFNQTGILSSGNS
jgi:hypothetical protein